MLKRTSAFSETPFGPITVTSTIPIINYISLIFIIMCINIYYILPLPAEKVSTVKLAGAPTIGPTGSIPGP